MDLHYSKEYLDFEKEVKAFVNMMALLLQMQVRTLLQVQAVRKKDTSHQGVSGKKFLSNMVILQEQF